MAGEAILGFLSGMMKQKADKFKEELKRKADLNALFEEIKLKNQLETEAEKNKPQEFETWIHKKTGKSISVPKTANQLERTSFGASGYVPESTYDKVKEKPADKKQKIPFEKLPEELKTIVPYWDNLDQDLQDVLIQSYTEEALKQQKLVHPKTKSLAETIREATNSGKPTSKALPSLKDVLIPKSVSDKVKNTTILTQPTSKTKHKAKVTTTRPLLDAGFIKKKDGYFLPRFIDATR